MIKNKDMECFHGLIIDNIRDTGKMGNNMEEENI